MKKRRQSVSGLFWPFLLLILLTVIILNFSKIQQLITRATGTPANIVVDASLELGEINPVWQAFAQGGEENRDMLAPVIDEVKNLTPKYIRIDHIYDHFNLVSRTEQGNLNFNFSQLDSLVNSILKTGALPFFSLSYMPQSLTSSGNITDQPGNYNDWAWVIQRTIEHYSGTKNLNLDNVYYEVWNEPDLFGGWKTYGSKNYLTLYRYAAIGAQNAQGVNNFKIGGPATTAFYKNWVESLADYVSENNLRLDFFSWHRYNLNPDQYAADISAINHILMSYPDLVYLPRLITEYGFDSEINPGYDNNFAAVHALATIKQSLYGYTYLFAFEIVDGKSPQNQQYWGRWGLITHPETGKNTKPRYRAFMLLNQMWPGTRLFLKGEGSWVTGFAVKNKNSIKVLIINYDKNGIHSEAVPLKIEKIAPGNYLLKRQRLGQAASSNNLQITATQFATEEILPANSAILLDLTFQPATSGGTFQETGG